MKPERQVPTLERRRVSSEFAWKFVWRTNAQYPPPRIHAAPSVPCEFIRRL
jgi:hypothetical protein